MPNMKRLLIVIAIFAAVLLGSMIYIGLLLHSYAIAAPKPKPVVAPATLLSAALAGQNLLVYDLNATDVPYAIFSYSSANSTSITVNASLLKSRPPQNVYLLNPYPECTGCNGASQVYQYLAQDMVSYGVIGAPADLQNVTPAGLQSMPGDSMLIMLNGLMPQYMFQPVSGTNATLLQYLLNRGDSIIYVGQSFSNMLLSDGVIVPNPSMPTYLMTQTVAGSPAGGFYFTNSTFIFVGGLTYGPITYKNIANGTIVAFSNTLSGWPGASYAAADIAHAASLMFWLPAYASGASTVALNRYTDTNGEIGVLLSSPPLPYSASLQAELSSGFLRAVVYNSANYSISPNNRYITLTAPPSYSSHGFISMPGILLPGKTAQLTMSVFTGSGVPVSIQPHISIYTINMIYVTSLPLQPLSASGNFTFLTSLLFPVPPGSYIAELQGFSGNLYASALFNVSPIAIALKSANYTSNRYLFALSSDGQPLSGIGYSISLDNLYRANGTISNGTIAYSLPSGSPELYGTLTFNISMLSSSFVYKASHPPTTITVNRQYIILAIVLVIVVALVTLVRAPNRDDFYIDVPHLPKRDVVKVKLPYRDVISVFDKLNMYYHWRYMPLSKAEIRAGIATNIRSNGMPVNLTYNNLSSILDQLVVHGDLIVADDLYAPKAWIEQSGHDLEYLVTFKKLRMYMVTHAYVFTDLNMSPVADMVVALHGERTYLMIYSQTSKFKKVPVYKGMKTYLVFMNADRLDEFKSMLYRTPSAANEELKMYIASGRIALVNAESMDGFG
ncbi:hypothetical protein M1329_01470 [Candidatus Marsarchaeota archaeon]|nr:hypothetical protein [Candidatus Marsarchaeota archaeon]